MEFQGAMLVILLPEVLVFSTYYILTLSQKKKKQQKHNKTLYWNFIPQSVKLFMPHFWIPTWNSVKEEKMF